MAMDPTSEEMIAFTSIRKVIEWVGLSEAAAEALLDALQATGEENTRLFGALLEDHFTAFTANLELPPLQRTGVALVGRACRVQAGAARSVSQLAEDAAAATQGAKEAAAAARDATAAAAAAQTAAPLFATGLVEMGSVVNQRLREQRPALTPEKVRCHYETYRRTFGRDPPPDEECSGQQLTGVEFFLSTDVPPYVDFGVWGPHHHRLLRRMRFSAAKFTFNGELQQVELLGPENFTQWSESYRLLTTAFRLQRRVARPTPQLLPQD